MGLPVVRYQSKDRTPAWGVLRDGSVFELSVAASNHRDLLSLYGADAQEVHRSIGAALGTVEEMALVAPIDGSVQLFCQGLNYADHRAEGGVSQAGKDDENLIFTKAPSSICGPYDDIIRPKGCELLDYEIELAMVLSRDIIKPTHVSDAELQDYIGAVLIANDVSARDISFGAPAMQWFHGKSHRTFCPMGPVLYLLAPDDVQSLAALELTLLLNGAVKQSSSTEHLIHKPSKTLGDISAFANLYAGDCILTGTPGGVQLQMNPRTGLSILMNLRNDQKRRKKLVTAQLANNPYLQPGDKLELRIRSKDGAIDLGVQRNTVRDASP